MVLLALSFQLSCGANQSYQYTEEDSWKRGWFNYTEECAPETSVCLYRPYEKLPEEMRSAVQILDDSRDHQYKMCGYYNSLDECRKLCPPTLYCHEKQIDSSSTYDLVMDSYDNGNADHQQYSNRTFEYKASYLCSMEKPLNVGLIILLACIGGFVIAFTLILSVTCCISQRRQKQFAQQQQHLSRLPIRQLSMEDQTSSSQLPIE